MESNKLVCEYCLPDKMELRVSAPKQNFGFYQLEFALSLVKSMYDIKGKINLVLFQSRDNFSVQSSPGPRNILCTCSRHVRMESRAGNKRRGGFVAIYRLSVFAGNTTSSALFPGPRERG